MALTPQEALQLYDAMVQHWPEKESLQVSVWFVMTKSRKKAENY